MIPYPVSIGMRSRMTIEQLKAKLRAEPSSPVFAQLADGYRRRGEFAEAIRICQAGLAQYPTYGSAYLVLGRSYQEQGDLSSAREAFRRVIECDPGNMLAYRALGEIAEAENAAPEALTAYENALVFHPFAKDIRAAVARLTPRETEVPEAVPLRFAPQPDEPVPAVETPLATETLAHLYRTQGAHDRAADITARLTADAPGRQDPATLPAEPSARLEQTGEERLDLPEAAPASLRPEEGLRRLEAWQSVFRKLRPRAKIESGGHLDLLEAWRDAFRRLKPTPRRKGTLDLLEAWRDAFRRLRSAEGGRTR